MVGTVTGFPNWNLFNWFGGGGDQGLVPLLAGAEPVQFLIIQESSFLDLPPEVRGLILRRIPRSDYNNVRLVCRQLNHDVEHDIGVHARISGFEEANRPWMSFTLLEYIISLKIREAKIKKIQDSMEWLKSIRVTSLNIQHLSQLPPFSNENLLRNPFSLKFLTIKCGDLEKDRAQTLELLAQSNGLQKLHFTYSAPTRFLRWDIGAPFPSKRNDVLTFNTTMTNFFGDALRNLNSNSATSLIIRMDGPRTPREFHLARASEAYTSWLPMNLCHIGMPPVQEVPQQLQVPTTMKHIDIRVTLFRDVRTPYELGTQIHIWKSLLDAQTQLTSLRLRIGMMYWRFYEVILKKCYRTLKELDIEVGNWSDPDRTPATLDWRLAEFNAELIHVPMMDWFDWTVLFTPACNLESLILRMTYRSHLTANRTVNFCATFSKLKKLELQYVKISLLNLEQILLKLPELKEVTLRQWNILVNQPATFIAYMQEFEQTFEILRNSLRLQRLEKIKLYSELVSGHVYSNILGFQQRAIIDPNYTVVWSPHTLYLKYGTTWYYADPTLAIFKNP